MDKKQCTNCKERKPREGFSIRPERAGNLHSWCIECRTKNMREWRKRKKEEDIVAYRERERRHNLNRYGITPEEYDELLNEQDRRCAICAGPPTGKHKRFHVDHDHDTGEVRALLCHSCNTGLGAFREDALLLRHAADYLDDSKR